jgi:hypothetical protein
MTFPTTPINTSNLDESTDDPSLARADLLDAVEKLNTIIDEAGQANGVCVLSGTGRIPATALPVQISLTSGVQVINPTSGIVNIQDVLRMQQMTTADIEALVDPQAGDIAFASDGDAGSPCLSVYNGTDWVRISVGAAISAT